MLIGSSCGNAFTSSSVDDVVLRFGGRGVFSSGNAADSILVEAVVPTDVGGEVMLVSQFTLMANTKKGNRPSYIHAAHPEISRPLYEEFCSALEKVLGKEVARGRFGADMQIELVNDGPVTITIDTARDR